MATIISLIKTRTRRSYVHVDLGVVFGVPSSPRLDLGVVDLGVMDLGVMDLGVVDLGVVDLGVADARLPANK